MRKDFWATGSCRKKDGWLLSVYRITGERYKTVKVKRA